MTEILASLLINVLLRKGFEKVESAGHRTPRAHLRPTGSQRGYQIVGEVRPGHRHARTNR
jgi:hypothetical protein